MLETSPVTAAKQRPRPSIDALLAPSVQYGKIAELAIHAGTLFFVVIAYVLLTASHDDATVERYLILLGVLAFAGASGWLSFRLIKPAAYRPGKTFKVWRMSDQGIAWYYGAAIWGGLACMIYAIYDGFTTAGSLEGPVKFGISAFVVMAIGLHGSTSKAVHGDVDYVAVRTLRESGLLGQEKVYGAYQNFDATQRQNTVNDLLSFGLLADGFVMLFVQDGRWSKVRKQFDDITAIGISSDGFQVHYLLRFFDGTQYKIKIATGEKFGTEIMSFTRRFLTALDASLTGQPLEAAPAQRRRVAAPVAANGDVHVRPTPRPQAETEASAGGRHLELDRQFVKSAQQAMPLGAGRSLELNCK